MVWQAICTCGERSQSFITSGTINSQIYIEECLKKRLLPFINSHSISTFFWPDLASCHYSKATMEWYETNNVNVVPKDVNPPNVPELRPIERYWALCKRNLKESKKRAENIENFRRLWQTGSRKVTNETIKSLMLGIPKKIVEFCREN